MAATTLDSLDFASLLAQELLYQQLVSSLEGLHSGVPTRTTPTLTPTTLRTIEQTFLDFENESAKHSREAGFVPPLIEPSQPTPALTPPLHIQPQVQLQIQQPQLLQQGKTAKKNMGGRRPTRTIGMTPEEEERRQIRRERNKMAAARCRKRRMDHTNALLEETEGLEQKKLSLQDEISQLQQEKDDLEFMLEAHRPVCRLQSSSPPDVKPVITDNGKITLPSVDSQQQHLQQPEEFSDLPSVRLSRPNTLPIPTFTEPKPRPSSLQFKTVETPAFMKTMNEIAGIPITTPSTVDLSSPDANPKLVSL
ncbi:hypothetical protein QAD02_005567 [Eretmocerus hayati]|uniref:Uncharacterized protein n=1 Tax=Eretmocerus hayati TaxID=131215 RepID=A0ACC2NSM7_9HYME|nr:hypothetical protein QAD02_005567 [Eretmocerus hayati]